MSVEKEAVSYSCVLSHLPFGAGWPEDGLVPPIWEWYTIDPRGYGLSPHDLDIPIRSPLLQDTQQTAPVSKGLTLQISSRTPQALPSLTERLKIPKTLSRSKPPNVAFRH
jgi:hypothetical protein